MFFARNVLQNICGPSPNMPNMPNKRARFFSERCMSQINANKKGSVIYLTLTPLIVEEASAGCF